VLAAAPEIDGLLSAGELVAVGLGWQPLHPRIAGPLTAALVGPARRRGVPVLPVVARGHELGWRRWVRIDEPVPHPAPDVPDADVELAEGVRAAIQALLTL
jgi:hypothetical protein